VPGFEWNFNKSFALDVSAAFSYYSVSEYDLSPVGLSPASSGSTFEGRLGVRWHPDNGYPSGPRPSVPEDSPRDAWGVSKNYGWAAVEVLGINWVSKSVNEYVRNGNFNQVSPRSWWANIKEGFTYDDNEFRTNQYIHPFNGAAYFNSARGNGLGYWTSAAHSVTGRPAGKRDIEHHDDKAERAGDGQQRYQARVQQPLDARERRVPEGYRGAVEQGAGRRTEIAVRNVHCVRRWARVWTRGHGKRQRSTNVIFVLLQR
jgi:hypothetical protein